MHMPRGGGIAQRARPVRLPSAHAPRRTEPTWWSSPGTCLTTCSPPTTSTKCISRHRPRTVAPGISLPVSRAFWLFLRARKDYSYCTTNKPMRTAPTAEGSTRPTPSRYTYMRNKRNRARGLGGCFHKTSMSRHGRVRSDTLSVSLVSRSMGVNLNVRIRNDQKWTQECKK